MSSAEEPLSTSEVCRKIQGALDNMSRSLRCPVCQSTMVADSIVLSKCNHAYCRPCIERCLKEKRLCPVCHQKCHPRRSLTEDPRLAALGRQTVALYRHFGLAPVHHLESKPMMTQLSPEHDERRLTTVHRTLQVSRTFRKALPSQEDALQEIVTANEKALLKVVTGRRDQHPECCQVQDKKPAAAEDAKKSDEKTPSQTNTKAESSMEEEPAGASGDADIVQKVEAEGDLFHQSKLGENRARGRFGKRNNDVQLVQPLGHILTTEDKAVPAEVTVHNTSSPQVTSQVSEHTQPILNDQESTKSPLPTTPEVTTKQTAKATSDSESDDDDWVAVIQQANPQEQTPLTKPASEKKTHTSTSEETSHTVANPQGESPTAGSHEFKVGDIVNVQARTWPGMNKPGGTARVTGLVANGYNVAYILGSRERNVDTSFVSAPLDVKPRSRGKTELSCQVLQELEAQGFGLYQQRRVGTDAASAPVSVKAKKKRPAQKLVGDSDKKRSRQTVDVSQIPEWTTEEMYALADAWYQECLAKGFKNKVMHVVATNLSDKCMKAMKRLEKESQIWEGKSSLNVVLRYLTRKCHSPGQADCRSELQH